MTDDDKHKVLDLRMPKEEQKKILSNPVVAKYLHTKKYKVTVKDGHLTRYMYGDDPDILEGFAIAKGLKILRTEKL